MACRPVPWHGKKSGYATDHIHYISLFMASKVSTLVFLNRLYISVVTPGAVKHEYLLY